MSQKIDFKKQHIPFTQVANTVLEDPRLTWKAKGIYGYIYSKPDGWEFSTHRMKEASKCGRDSLLDGIKELEKLGYITKNKLPTGKVQYLCSYEPQSEKPTMGIQKPKSEKPTVGKTHRGKSRPISNTEVLLIRKDGSNTDIAAVTAAVKTKQKKEPKAKPITSEDVGKARQVRDVIEAFCTVDPACKTLYGNKTERGACEFLINTYTFATVMQVIKLLPQTNKKEFLPVITSPFQLQKKWVALEVGLIKMKSKINKPKMI